ncbi:helix-turn-helix domain-containing protein [Paenibacillus sp. 1P07SE]|uniref:AraC family transcriptional regulator n=1 Tax=Paenibacillus sp. 1P07SE TaxID=3132209 RepID=UPI0039A4A4FD
MPHLSESRIEHAQVHYFDPGPFERKSGLWCIRMGTNRAKPLYSVGPRTIECYGLHLVLEGRLTLRYGDLQAELQAGDAFCLYPGHTYQYGRTVPRPTASGPPAAAQAEAPLRLFWISFDGPQAAELLSAIGMSSRLPYRRDCFPASLQPALQQLLASAAGEAAASIGRSMQLQAELYTVLAALLPAAPAHPPSEPADWFERCLAFMEQHCTEEITIREIAEHIPVHRSHLHETFISRMGCSPGHYLQSLRMDKAKDMLRNSSRSMSDIAHSVGYASLYSFARAFSRVVGCPPGAYRRGG